ncbi:hypothetical protein EWI07_08195 [Sporolactobacillus sp. THM7-4]|nr:hypothetical protein EWI07_08195 [Sporolactobacillus sp. THM7-4]
MYGKVMSKEAMNYAGGCCSCSCSCSCCASTPAKN